MAIKRVRLLPRRWEAIKKAAAAARTKKRRAPAVAAEKVAEKAEAEIPRLAPQLLQLVRQLVHSLELLLLLHTRLLSFSSLNYRLLYHHTSLNHLCSN